MTPRFDRRHRVAMTRLIWQACHERTSAEASREDAQYKDFVAHFTNAIKATTQQAST